MASVDEVEQLRQQSTGPQGSAILRPVVRSDEARRRELGVRLKAARLAAGYTQEQAGELIGRSHQRIGAIERGEMDLPAITLVILARAYDVSLDGLLHNV